MIELVRCALPGGFVLVIEVSETERTFAPSYFLYRPDGSHALLPGAAHVSAILGVLAEARRGTD